MMIQLNKLICLLALFISMQSLAVGQQIKKPISFAKEIKRFIICCGEDTFYREYSSLATWKQDNRVSSILLVPQRPGESKVSGNYKEDPKVKIVSVDASDITQSMKSDDQRVLAAKELEIMNLQILRKIPGYSGIEATVLKGNDIYFSIETDSSVGVCYILMGKFDAKKGKITIQDKKISIPKPKGYIGNAGFESLVYLPGKKQILAIFEKNHLNDSSYLIDISLKKYYGVAFKKSLFFRVTDACRYRGDTIIAINHHYNKDAQEFDFYIGNSNAALKTASAQMYNHNPRVSSYTGLIKIYFENDHTLTWEDFRPISFNEFNWEGITLFDKGVLMIVDAMPSSPQLPSCIFSYFDFR